MASFLDTKKTDYHVKKIIWNLPTCSPYRHFSEQISYLRPQAWIWKCLVALLLWTNVYWWRITKEKVGLGFKQSGVCAFLSHLWSTSVSSEHALTFPTDGAIGRSLSSAWSYIVTKSVELGDFHIPVKCCWNQPRLKSYQAETSPNQYRVWLQKNPLTSVLKCYQ